MISAMAQRTTPPFRADHVGSFIRPPELIRARDEFAAGRIAAEELRAAEDKAIRDVVRLQQDAGLQCVTDGEFRRKFWHLDFFHHVGGVTENQERITVPFRDDAGAALPVVTTTLRVNGRLKLDRVSFGDHFAFLKSIAAGSVAKQTIPAPSLLHRRGGPSVIDPAIYPEMGPFWADLSRVYADEIAGLYGLGCRYLQLDDTSFASLCDPAQRAAMTKAGNDGDRIHLQYIKVINDALKAKPADMAVCIHTCRGNYKGAWIAAGAYDFIAEAMLGELAVDGFFLEYDDARSGGFEPLRFMPKGKMAVLGIVTTKKGALESKDAIKRRIDEAAKYIPIDQICLSPQCGFSSVLGANALNFDEQRAKLRLVAEVAREVWG
jgi:5-methyltetrahydropteroyltriglutamate--homocysteine methyltransferase